MYTCSAFLLQLLDDLHDAARSESRCAKLDELLRVLQRRDAARGLDSDARLHVLREQLHIVERRAAGGEAGGGLDIIRAGIGDDLAHLDLFVVRQQAGLDDDLQELALAGGLDGPDLFEQIAPALILDQPMLMTMSTSSAPFSTASAASKHLAFVVS